MPLTKDSVIDEIINLIAHLENQGISISTAYLFGSYATGRAGEWSDIDLALVSESFSDSRFDTKVKLIPLIREFNCLLEIHPYRPEDFDPEEDLFIKEILKTGIKIK